MALVVIAANISNLNDISDYNVRVQLNDLILWKGQVKGHKRSEGWKVLLKQISEATLEEENGKT